MPILRQAMPPKRAVRTPFRPVQRRGRRSRGPTAADHGRAVQVTVAAPVHDRAGRRLGTLAGNLNLDRSDVTGPIAAVVSTHPIGHPRRGRNDRARRRSS
jgi:hypothetical protein